MAQIDEGHAQPDDDTSKPSKMPTDLTAPQAWQRLLKNAFSRRFRPHQFEHLVKEMLQRYRPNPVGLARLVISFRKVGGHSTDDPLFFRYVEVLLSTSCVGAGDIIRALQRHSSFAKLDAVHRETSVQLGFPSCEERIFTILTRRYLTDPPATSWKTFDLIHAITEWLHVVSTVETTKQVQNAGMHAVDVFTYNTYEALARLAIEVLRNPTLRSFVKHQWWVANRAKTAERMEAFDVNILQWMQSQFAGPLSVLTGQPPFIEIDKNGKPVFTDRQVLSMIPELPVAYGRGGLFIWLESALAARPLTDDMTMLSYLQARFPGDTQSLIVSILVASFDVLTSAMLRKEPRQTVKLIRSFICNKLPVLLSVLAASVASPLMVENSIQMPFVAGGSISMNPLPPITAGASDMNEILKATRLELLQACAMHGLITENGIATVLNGPVALPRVTKYVKETLVAQCSNNISRLEALIDDLVGFQGNSAAIAGCVVTIIQNLCSAKDTMSLKNVCTELIKRTSSIDTLMQYTQPSILLLPLCTVLNEWVHDQEQAEFTPSYEEFASILLFTVAVMHHFSLTVEEIGTTPDTFMGKFMDAFSSSQPPTDLSDDQNAHLGKWIEGLFSVDEHGESSGIGDEVMRQCPPPAFYLLVPTLFEQSVIACRNNVLNMKAFQGGLELLLEPFLLPSLIMGLTWLAKHSWEDHNDAAVLLQILDKLLKPSSSSQETQSMHLAIVTIVATPLFESLQTFMQKNPANKKAQELGTLLQRAIGRLQPLQRDLNCSKTQLETLMRNEGNIKRYVSESIKTLMTWSITSSSEASPSPAPAFSYKTFAIASQVLTGDVLLDTILEEVQDVQQAQLPLALDVITALACAPPSITASIGAQHVLEATSKLRSSIQLRCANIQGLLNRPTGEAETLIQLSRRLETQLAMTRLPTAMNDLPITDLADPQHATDQIMQDFDLNLDAADVSAAAAAAVAGADASLVQQMDMENSIDLGESLDLTTDAATQQQLDDLSAAVAQSSNGAMNIDDAGIFGDMVTGLGMTQADGGLQQDALADAVNPDEDIFADLMGAGDFGDLGEEFNF